MSPAASVVVLAGAVPALLPRTLTDLQRQTTPPREIIVVGADARARTAVPQGFPDVRLLDCPPGDRDRARWWQLGLSHARTEVVAFLAAGAQVDAGWLGDLLRPYDDPEVVAVGGRVAHGSAGEETRGLTEIGLLLPDGRLTENFGADPGRMLDVNHLPEANMSVRRAAAERVGGLGGAYPRGGPGAGTELALRLGAAGGRVVFAPRAVVRLTGSGPDRRSDLIELYRGRRNQVLVLLRAFGWRHPAPRRSVWSAVRDQVPYLHEARRRMGAVNLQGRRRRLRKRLRGPAVLLESAAELVGLVGGLVAGAAGAMRGQEPGAQAEIAAMETM